MKRFVAAAVVAGGLTVACGTASAQSILRQPNGHINQLELEPHATFGVNYYSTGFSGVGLGAGVRVGFPIINNGPIPRANNSLAISIGGDFLYQQYYCGGGSYCVNLTLIPAVMVQWNFYFTPMLSAFAEVGFAPVIEFRNGSAFLPWPGPGGAIGGRVHFKGRTDFPALTVRIGFPVGVTVGVSF